MSGRARPLGVGSLLAALVLAAGCGGGASRAAHPAPPCAGASCDALDLWPDVAAVALDTARVLVVATRPSPAALVAGVAQIDGTTWDAHSLHFASVAVGATGPIAAVQDGDGVAVAFTATSPPAIVLVRLRLDGQPDHAIQVLGSPVSIATGAPRSLALTRDASGHLWCAFTSSSDTPFAPGLARIEGDRVTQVHTTFAPVAGARIALVARGDDLLLARASSAGVELARVVRAAAQAPAKLATAPARDVAVAALPHGAKIAFTDEEGVSLVSLRDGASPGPARRVDDGARTGEPAHRVGAALTAAPLSSEVVLLAYQDQTAGTLVTARAKGGLAPRQDHPEPAWTRAFAVAIAKAGRGAFVLDLAARTAPHLERRLLVTPIP